LKATHTVTPVLYQSHCFPQCPAGMYLSSPSCIMCPSSTPYSAAGATSAAACSSCSGSTSCSNSYGRYACPAMDWTVWYDTTGVETANSCVKFYSNALDWVSSRDACAAVATGVHLATFRTVSTAHTARGRSVAACTDVGSDFVCYFVGEATAGSMKSWCVWHGVVHCADGIHRGVTAPSQRLANDLRAELRWWLQGPRRQPAHRVVMGGQHPGDSNELRQHSV
jgi:hypothetical protein